jgi:Methyltransferase domain
MSVDGLAGRGITGDSETTQGGRAQRARAGRTGRGPAADASALAAPAPGVRAPRQARERVAAPGTNVTILGPETGAAAAAPVQAAPVPQRHRQAPAAAAAVATGGPAARAADAGLFARYTREYVTGRDGQQVTVLQAGCTTADGDLGVGGLLAEGADIVVSLIDDDESVTRAAVSMHESLAGCVPGDLRSVPLPPRSQDIVLCALLLQRIQHAELVLDRLVAALRPGGLLLLRFRDGGSAAGFLDRVLPMAARRVIWRKRRPGQPGPYPAVYERLSSMRGVQAYVLMRELVIAERQALGGTAGALANPPGFLALQKLVAWLSRGRLTAEHEELLYVVRKPEDRFARIV